MKNKPKTGMPLHVQVALGKKPKAVVVTKGLTPKTVTKLNKKR